MALLSIFRVIQVSLSSRLLLTQREKEVVSDFVSKAEKEAQGSVGYNENTAEERAAIVKYTTENGPAKAC